MTPQDGSKSFLKKIFEEYLQASELAKKLVDNITITALETKKIADLMLKMNDRLNQQERVILTLLDLHNERERREKEKNTEYVSVKPKDKSKKPN